MKYVKTFESNITSKKVKDIIDVRINSNRREIVNIIDRHIKSVRSLLLQLKYHETPSGLNSFQIESNECDCSITVNTKYGVIALNLEEISNGITRKTEFIEFVSNGAVLYSLPSCSENISLYLIDFENIIRRFTLHYIDYVDKYVSFIEILKIPKTDMSIIGFYRLTEVLNSKTYHADIELSFFSGKYKYKCTMYDSNQFLVIDLVDGNSERVDNNKLFLCLIKKMDMPKGIVDFIQENSLSTLNAQLKKMEDEIPVLLDKYRGSIKMKKFGF